MLEHWSASAWHALDQQSSLYSNVRQGLTWLLCLLAAGSWAATDFHDFQPGGSSHICPVQTEHTCYCESGRHAILGAATLLSHEEGSFVGASLVQLRRKQSGNAFNKTVAHPTRVWHFSECAVLHECTHLTCSHATQTLSVCTPGRVIPTTETIYQLFILLKSITNRIKTSKTKPIPPLRNITV